MVEEIIKTFTRYILPGFAFFICCLAVPAALLDPSYWDELMNQTTIVVVGIISGFILDGFGAYRYNFHRKLYDESKSNMAKKLAELTSGETKASDPDLYIAELWVKNESLYNRIFHERAEWVSIMNTAFVMNLAWAISCFVLPYLLWSHQFRAALLSLGYGLFTALVGFGLSKTGSKRMAAHDAKVVEAVRHVRDSSKLK